MGATARFTLILGLYVLLGALLALYVFKREAPPSVPTINVFQSESGIVCVTATHQGAVALTCNFDAEPAPSPKKESQHSI